MGMALYGRGFMLDDSSHHGLYAPAKDGIKMGPYTRQDGTWGYNEICEVFKTEKDDWKIVIDPYIQAPYAYKNDMWIGYDDVESLYVKVRTLSKILYVAKILLTILITFQAKFARDLDLGGAMVWSIETDDFRGYCHNRKYPLINTIRKTMNGGTKPVIPDRPPVVEAEDDNIVDVDVTTSKPSKPKPKPGNKRTTTTPEPDYYPDEEDTTTTRRTRPSRRPRTTTTPSPEEIVEEIEETTKKPSRPSRRPRTTTTPSPEEIEEIEETTKRPNRPLKPKLTTTTENAEIIDAIEVGQTEEGECVTEGVQANGKDCHSFLICQDLGGGRYMKHVQRCAHGLVYDPVVKGCNFASQVPSCKSKRKGQPTFYRKHSS